MIDNDLSMDVVQRMLDHGSAGMTARYATIKDQTLRREWDRFMQRINITGELVPLPDGSAMSDAAWALENLARAKQTLANGYCGLPLQQTCPHPNACLTCDSFLTTAEFLPAHRDELTSTEQLVAAAEVEGRQRLVEINEPRPAEPDPQSSTASTRSRAAMAAEPLDQAAAPATSGRSSAPNGLARPRRRRRADQLQSVARRAGVSRQWLYTQPALRSEIERLRDRPPAESDGIPTRRRPRGASLRQRVETLRTENQRLRKENANLKAELALPYGRQRQAAAPDTCRAGPVGPGFGQGLEIGTTPDA